MIIILADKSDPHLPAANASSSARRRVMNGPASSAQRDAGSLLVNPQSKTIVRPSVLEAKGGGASVVYSEPPLR